MKKLKRHIRTKSLIGAVEEILKDAKVPIKLGEIVNRTKKVTTDVSTSNVSATLSGMKKRGVVSNDRATGLWEWAESKYRKVKVTHNKIHKPNENFTNLLAGIAKLKCDMQHMSAFGDLMSCVEQSFKLAKLAGGEDKLVDILFEIDEIVVD